MAQDAVPSPFPGCMLTATCWSHRCWKSTSAERTHNLHATPIPTQLTQLPSSKFRRSSNGEPCRHERGMVITWYSTNDFKWPCWDRESLLILIKISKIVKDPLSKHGPKSSRTKGISVTAVAQSSSWFKCTVVYNLVFHPLLVLSPSSHVPPGL